MLATLLLLSTACSEKSDPVQLSFIPTWQSLAIDCQLAAATLTDLRFYVSDVSLIDSSGQLHPLDMTEDGVWQQANIALIDFENGQGGCSNGTPATNNTVRGTATRGDYRGVRFTLGVPFELNHANPLIATAPLGDGAMHWHWRAGYKFMRAGVRQQNDSVWLHLGSTGCEGTVQDISGCAAPNRLTVELMDFSPDRDKISIDLSALFAHSDLRDGVPSDCSSGPSESTCAGPFSALGLDFGQATGTAQRVFKVQR